MPVTITGGRYAIRSLSSVGTTNVTIGTGTFVSGDFGANQRMVSLHSSTGAFKGIAWVRRFISTTQLELEGRFVDPVTGLFATQLVGDQVLVSKNSIESATPGFTVASPDNNIVTVSDNILMGTGGVETSLCFYDENKQYTMTNGFRFNGGVAVFGKLIAYDGVSKESFIWSRECTARPNEAYPGGGGDPAFNIWGTGGAAGHMFFFGGALGSPMRRSFFIGAQTTGASNGSFAMFGTRIYYAAASPNNGGNWAVNPSRHLLFKTIHEADYNNANLIVWGNGAFQASFLSFPQFGAGTPLGIFRASSSGTVEPLGASANNRTVVADLGTGTLIDDINNGIYDFVNVIAPSVSISRFAGGNVPITMRFSDDYTNLQPRTTVVVRRGDGTIVSSVVNTTVPTFTATVVQATYSATANGTATPTNFYTTFNYGIKCYGFNVVSGTHMPYTYSLGTAGNGTDLRLGGLINQVADSGVTLTETEALALASKITVNSGTSTITVTANATYDELYDYTVAWNASSAANAVIPNLTRYLLTFDGTALSAPAGWTLSVNNGVVLNEGTKFKSVAFTTVNLNASGQITGLYSAGGVSNKILEITGVTNGSSLYVGNNATGITTLFQANTNQSTYRVYFAPGTTPAQLVARELYPFQRSAQVVTLVDGLNVVNLVDIPDIGITEEDLATVLAYTEIEIPSKYYDRTAAFRLTEQGIKLGQMVTRSGTALENGDFSHLINKDATLVYSVTGSVITTKSTSYAADDRYQTEISNPPATITANSTEVLTINREDGNGNSQITIAGGRGTYEIWKITSATASADYESGTKVGDFTTANNKYRFIGDTDPGFDYLTVDLTTTVKDRYPATKGVYVHSLYSGAEIQLAQAPEVIENGIKLDVIKVELAEIKAKTDNLPADPAAVGDAMTLTSAYDAAKTAATQESVDEVKAKTDGLTFTVPDKLDVNIKYVNDIEVKGTGEDNDPWNPV